LITALRFDSFSGLATNLVRLQGYSNSGDGSQGYAILASLGKLFMSMKCLRCGQCCITHEVCILDDPAKGIIMSNIIGKHTGERCKHLLGNEPGKFSCAIHNYSWYSETPCYNHDQIGKPGVPCRLGEHYLKNYKKVN
jgi:hypothetical protein